MTTAARKTTKAVAKKTSAKKKAATTLRTVKVGSVSSPASTSSLEGYLIVDSYNAKPDWNCSDGVFKTEEEALRSIVSDTFTFGTPCYIAQVKIVAKVVS